MQKTRSSQETFCRHFSKFVETPEHEVHNLTNLIFENSYIDRLIAARKFKNWRMDIEEINKSAVEFGLRIEIDRFGGYCLVNRNAKFIK